MEEAHNSSLSLRALTDSLRRHRWVCLAVFVLVISGGIAVSISLPGLYRSETVLLLGQSSITESLVTSGGSVPLDQRLHMVEQQLRSRERQLALIEEFDLYPGLRGAVPEALVLDRMRQDVAISRRSTGQASAARGQAVPMEVRIGYQGWDPRLVAEVANTLARQYQEIYESMRFTEASRTTLFLREELDSVETRLREQEERIRAFREENLGRLPQQIGVNLATLQRLNADLERNGTRQIQLLEERLNQAVNPSGDMTIPTSGEARLGMLKRQWAERSTRLNEGHPEMIRLRREIGALETMIHPASEESTQAGEETIPVPVDPDDELARLIEEERQLRSSIRRLQQQIERIPAVEQELDKLEHEHAVIREQRLALQGRYEEARLTESMERQQQQESRVLEAALPPELASAPDRVRLMILSFGLAAAATAGIVYLFSVTYHGFSRADDLRRYTTVPVLASISRMRSRGEWTRRALLAMLLTAAYLIFLGGFVAFAYESGQTARGIVWLLAGANG